MSYGGPSDLDPAIFGEGVLGDPDGWSGFTGDFYREPDTVVRGVTMAQDVPDALDPACLKGFAGGDFYRDTDDFYRGLSMAAVPEAEPPDFFGKVPDSLSKIEPGFGNAAELLDQFRAIVEPFTEAGRPPMAPSGPFFRFENTTVFIPASSVPSDVGNQLLDILSMKVTATITKVNYKKFAIKADAFVGNTMCSLKVRVYKQEQGSYAVEFQLRSGDRMTFHNIYQEASKWLSSHSAAKPSAPKFGVEFAAAAGPPLPLAGADARAEGAFLTDMSSIPTTAGGSNPTSAGDSVPMSVGDSIPLMELSDTSEKAGPLLDMAGRADRPDLQAEAAAALADTAGQDSRTAAALCTAEAFQEFKVLLMADQLNIAYPTARLLTLLAQCPEAKQHFADAALLVTIIGKVQDGKVAALAQKQFAQSLTSAISHCVSALTEEDIESVSSALSKAARSTDVADATVQRALQEALHKLKCQCPRSSA